MIEGIGVFLSMFLLAIAIGVVNSHWVRRRRRRKGDSDVDGSCSSCGGCGD